MTNEGTMVSQRADVAALRAIADQLESGDLPEAYGSAYVAMPSAETLQAAAKRLGWDVARHEGIDIGRPHLTAEPASNHSSRLTMILIWWAPLPTLPEVK